MPSPSRRSPIAPSACTSASHATAPLLRQQITRDPSQASGTGSLGAELALLQTLGNGPDPTIAVDSLADLPRVQVSPRPALSIAGGIFAGLILGIGAAFAAQALDPRLRREQQLRRRYRLPILTRIRVTPAVARPPSHSAQGVAPATAEAYRTLRATLARNAPGATTGRVILVTGSTVSEGKTTTAVNLAASLALAGQRVILIESDLRRPSLGKPSG